MASPPRTDLLIALALAALSVLQVTVVHPIGPVAVGLVVALGNTLPIAWRRVHPVAATLEVLRLVGRGMSNAEIAAELVISTATVKTHVRHVLQKLRLRDRVQAVVVAYESGVVGRG